MHPLDGPRLRLAVAHDKIQELKGAIRDRANNLKIPPPTFKYNPKTRKNVAFIEFGTICDPRWAVTVGEIAHNIRASLDGLVYQLALLNKRPDEISTRTEFPIFLNRRDRQVGGKTRKGFEQGSIPKLADLRPHHRTPFQWYQPYKRRNAGKHNALWRLHELNNTDKHRIVPVIALVAHRVVLKLVDNETDTVIHTVAMPRTARMRRVERGTELTLPLRGAGHPNVGVQLHLAVDVRFDKGLGPNSGRGVVSSLNKMHSHVDGIINDFSRLFP